MAEDEKLYELVALEDRATLNETRNLISESDFIAGCHCYDIDDRFLSDRSILLFAHHMETHERVVIKVLCEYKDERCSHETVKGRQDSQLLALERNRYFNPESDLYIGLGPVDLQSLQKSRICFEEILSTPDKSALKPGTDYALLMHRLPADRFLDALLQELHDRQEKYLLPGLIDYVVKLHMSLVVACNVDEENVKWGNIDQLQMKLQHNIGLLRKVPVPKRDPHYQIYSELPRVLCHALEKYRDAGFFEHRIQANCIKQCHGDLTATNICIRPYDQVVHDGALWKSVLALDAIDFNESYSNIDILSDFAMLVVDLQARTASPLLAEYLISEYLKHTGQQDEIAHAVLLYYLVEKAMVKAAITDKNPHLREMFFNVAAIYRKELQNFLMQMT